MMEDLIKYSAHQSNPVASSFHGKLLNMCVMNCLAPFLIFVLYFSYLYVCCDVVYTHLLSDMYMDQIKNILSSLYWRLGINCCYLYFAFLYF